MLLAFGRLTNITKTIFLGMALTGSFLCLASNASAATFLVNTANDTADVAAGDGACLDGAGQCSLRAAISEANALAGDDIITLPAGTYTQTLVSANDDANAGGDWDITSNITINGGGSATTFVQANAAAGQATERVINIRAGVVTISGVTIRNGRFAGASVAATTRGAGIENLGTLTLTNSVVRDNQITLTSGAGSAVGGGIYTNGGTTTLNNTTVTANSLSSTVTSSFGAGMAFAAVTVGTTGTGILTNSSVSGNSSLSTLTNGFGFGAGVYMQDVFNFTATGSQFNTNTGTGNGTGGSNGSGIRALSQLGAGTLTLTNCTVSGNVGTGGSANQGVGLQFFTSTAVAATLTATITNSTIANNTGNSNGLGINANAVGGQLTINLIRSTVSGHTGALNAAGILLSNAGTAVTSPITFNASNSTISGNSTAGLGGGFTMEQPGAGVVTANFNYSTVANNTAGTGGGMDILSGTANLKNTIVGDNTAATGPDIAGTVNSLNYNHIENLTGATITGTTTNNSTGDAALGPLANNGGPTLTHMPAGASPVVNTIPFGTNDCGNVFISDQRIFLRPQGGSCDKGSVEVGPTAAGVSVSGRVITSEGRGLTNAAITISGASGVVKTLITGRNGAFNFEDIAPGQTYVVTVRARRYSFTPRSIEVSDNVSELVFTPDSSLADPQ